LHELLPSADPRPDWQVITGTAEQYLAHLELHLKAVGGGGGEIGKTLLSSAQFFAISQCFVGSAARAVSF